MLDEQSISVIFDVLNNANSLNAGNMKTIDNIIRDYPYFIPARYIKAYEIYKNDAASPAFWGVIKGYEGNWLMFHNFLMGEPTLKETTIIQENEVVKKNIAQENKAEVKIPLTTETLIENLKDKININKIENPKDPNKDNIKEKITEKPFESIKDSGTEIFEHKNILKTKEPIQEVKKNHTLNLINEDLEIKQNEKTKNSKNKINYEDNITEEDAEFQDAENDYKFENINVVDADIEEIFETEQEETLKKPQNKEISNPTTISPPKVNDSTPDDSKENKPEADNKKEARIDENLDSDKILDELFGNISSGDYFVDQGVKISNEVPKNIENLYTKTEKKKVIDKALMVLMSFEEWLLHYKRKGEARKEEQAAQMAMKTLWESETTVHPSSKKKEEPIYEKNIETLEEEEDKDIEEEDEDTEIWSESLAQIYYQQGQYDLALDMYLKLKLQNPEKSAYFAKKIENIFKVK